MKPMYKLDEFKLKNADTLLKFINTHSFHAYLVDEDGKRISVLAKGQLYYNRKIKEIKSVDDLKSVKNGVRMVFKFGKAKYDFVGNNKYATKMVIEYGAKESPKTFKHFTEKQIDVMADKKLSVAVEYKLSF